MNPPAPNPSASSSLPLPRLLLIGVDHHTADVELRGKLTYDEDDAVELLRGLGTTPGIAEAALLSTCNRTELYLVAADDDIAYRSGLDAAFLARAPEVERQGRFYVHRDQQAAQHLMEVACGLQSMVLGEPEILGQVKRAAAAAEAAEASGPMLQRLMRAAIDGGRRARRDTAIGTGAVSFGYAVVDLTRNIFQHLGDCSVLLVGAGETARQVARNLVERGARQVRVANRSRERAESLREILPTIEIVPFDGRQAALADSDVVVAAASATEGPLLDGEDLEAAMRQRGARPFLVVDLGVPRNVDTAASSLDNLFLQDIDSLESLIARNLKRRRAEIPRVQELVDGELARLDGWLRGMAIEPVVRQIHRRAERLRRDELDAVLDRFPPETHDDLDRLTRGLLRKVLHGPSARLRGGALSDPAELEAVRRLFSLEDEPE